MRRHRLMVHVPRTFWASLALGLGLLGCLTGLALVVHQSSIDGSDFRQMSV